MDTLCKVPFGRNPEETAVLLLAAAIELGHDPDVVKTSGDGFFEVPIEVERKAFDHRKAAPAAKKTARKKAE